MSDHNQFRVPPRCSALCAFPDEKKALTPCRAELVGTLTLNGGCSWCTDPRSLIYEQKFKFSASVSRPPPANFTLVERVHHFSEENSIRSDESRSGSCLARPRVFVNAFRVGAAHGIRVQHLEVKMDFFFDNAAYYPPQM